MADQHGLSWVYAGGCRCAACTEAWMLYQRDLRHRREARTATYGLPKGVSHGLATYNNWGCRCDVCVGAKSARNAADRARRKSEARR